MIGEEAYQIKDYFHDEAVAFAGALNPKGKLACNEDEMYSTERLKSESCNPEDTIPVATFLKKNSTKKAYFYFASFTESHWEAAHMEVYSIFSFQWEKEWNHLEKLPLFCCSVISEQPQPHFHKKAANWMLKRMTTKDSIFDCVDYFMQGKLELLI